MRVLVACEYSGIVRDAFAQAGHFAMSCDLLPSDRPGNHYQGSVFDIISDDWDLMIAHPPCTHLATSGNRWMNDKVYQTAQALDFVRDLMDAPVPHIAIENPRSLISSRIRPSDQLIQPWQFGHGEQKAICLWLKNLPRLLPTHFVDGREQKVWLCPGGKNQGHLRSRFFEGIALAMVSQWSSYNSYQLSLI